MATDRPRRVSEARYTSPIPPVPMEPTISYGPSRAPAARDMVFQSPELTNRWKIKSQFIRPGHDLDDLLVALFAPTERQVVCARHHPRE